MSDRGYKVIYKSRASDSTDDQLSPQRSRRDYRYQDDVYEGERGMDFVSARSVQGSVVGGGRGGREITKTTYEVGRDRNAEAYVRGGNVVVIDQPRRRRGESESEWEVVEPQRNTEGAYVIDMGGESGGRGGGRRYEYEVEMSGRRDGRGREIEVLYPPERRDRATSRGLIEAMQQVQVTEDSSSEDERRSRVSRRGRSVVDVDTTAATGAMTMKRAPSAFRHDRSPGSDRRRRSRSVGFYKKEIAHHDASESRHERPGAEAHLAGKYLVGHRGEYIRRGDDDDVTVTEVRRSRTEDYDRYGREMDRRQEKTYYRDERSSYDDYERQGPYEPQQPPPPRRHRHRRHRRDDDDDKESRYSEYYEKTKKYD